ncbi:IS200/IS605 family transposase [Thiolapillus sp.]|uniref:IS200/IS605 family transposase n=1 Tax=Thiolapillus sp. TaxID=2017437 RepID=UPI003AF56AE5
MASFEPASSIGGHYERLAKPSSREALLVFVPKYRRKSIYGTLRKEIGGILRELCRQQGVELIEGYAMRDHIHMLLMIPPKYSVANTIGFLKGKSAIRIFREYLQVKRNWLFSRICG